MLGNPLFVVFAVVVIVLVFALCVILAQRAIKQAAQEAWQKHYVDPKALFAPVRDWLATDETRREIRDATPVDYQGWQQMKQIKDRQAASAATEAMRRLRESAIPTEPHQNNWPIWSDLDDEDDEVARRGQNSRQTNKGKGVGRGGPNL